MNANELLSNVGKIRGRFDKKENRAAKIIAMWPELESKFVGMIERGNGDTTNALCAYGTLLMMETGIRIGNEGSAEGFICENKHSPNFGQEIRTYGLTTLRHQHITKTDEGIRLQFVGKKSVDQDLLVVHPTLVRYLPTGPADELFLGLDYYELKQFIKRYVGQEFTPKDIRCAKVNRIFCSKFGNDPHLTAFKDATKKSERKKVLSNAIEETAAQIGHTKGVCRSAYLSSPLLRLIGELC